MSIYERFKPTPLSVTKERVSEVAQVTNQYDNEDSNDRIKKKAIREDGTYVIRIYPPHPLDRAAAIEPKAIYFLPAYVHEKDADGKWIKGANDEWVKKIGVKPVYDAKVHGGADHDLVDTYISLVKRKADQLYPSDEEGKKRYLLPLVGSFSSGSKYKGINLLRTFLFYGELITGKGENEKREFYEFEVKPSVYKQLNKIAAVEASDEAVGTDGCFTDPLEGRPVKIVVDSVASRQANDPSLYYSVSILNETEKIRGTDGRIINALKSYPISEEQLNWFDEQEPLVSYRTAFKHSDLKIQLEGLQLFDNEHGYGVLEEDEFKEIYHYLDSKFPEPEETDGDSEEKQQEVRSSKNDEDVFDLMDLAELKAHIKQNKLQIVILPRYKEEDLRELIREYEASTSLESEISTESGSENDAEGEVDGNPESDLKSRLSALRSKINA